MARIYNRQNVWYVDYKYNGKRYRKKIGKSKHMAELALKDIEINIIKGELGFSKADIKIEKLIDKFLNYNRTNHRATTTKRYKAVTDHLKRFLAEKRKNIVMVSQLSPEVIEEYKTFRRDEWVNPNGKNVRTDNSREGARARTVNIELDGIKTMLNLAIKWDYLKDNPMKHVKPLKVDDKKPIRFLTQDEYERFLEACPEHLYAIYYTFISTGMRKAELEHLRWSDVSLQSRQILIRRKPDWQPKTGEREIPINDDLLAVLESHKKKTKSKKRGDHIFEIVGGGKSSNMLRTELIKIAKVAEIADFTKVHSLRHTFASHLIMAGVDLPTVQKLMGHSDIETTMIYAHLAPGHLSNAVNKLQLKPKK